MGKTHEVFSAMKKIRSHDEETIIVTLGKLGVLALRGGERISVQGRNVDVVDTTGAGDCLIGAFASQFATGMSLQSSLKYANCAASLSVQHFGAASSMPTRKEIEQEL